MRPIAIFLLICCGCLAAHGEDLSLEDLDALALRDPDAAYGRVQQALDEDLDAVERTRLLLLAARIQRTLSGFEIGLDYAEKALDIARSTGSRELQVEAQHEMAIQYHLLGDDDRALGILNAAVELATFMDQPLLKARMLNTTGVIEWKAGELDAALRDLEESLRLRRELAPESEDIASNYNNIGIIHYDRGNLTKAREYHQKALEIRRKTNNRVGLAASLSNLGEVYNEMGDYALARELMLESLEIERDLGNPSNVALTLFNLGEVSSEVQDYESALAYYEESLEIQEAHDLEWGASLTLLHMGHDFNDRHLYEAAQQHLERGYIIAKRLKARGHLRAYARELARTHLGLGDERLADYYEDLASRIHAEKAELAMDLHTEPEFARSNEPATAAQAQPPTARPSPAQVVAQSTTRSADRSFLHFDLVDLGILLVLLIALLILFVSNRSLRQQLHEIRSQAARNDSDF